MNNLEFIEEAAEEMYIKKLEELKERSTDKQLIKELDKYIMEAVLKQRERSERESSVIIDSTGITLTDSWSNWNLSCLDGSISLDGN